ncbi:uncharacterized protein KY384_004600 [Bacidia gigantensis]|uniref:uncharacterized protein n=1 Tax=Bacidia gigantensis TaxID=2732470 RepID=UPI001D041BA5|nr:uncharacterized protein KY384_004600 [Bacidia gigantensis]KAG8531242.1 hypothetical protein KY384_004600 [Bacidia gigantensis]
MSGAGEASLIIGVLPLLVSAAENYRKLCLRPCQRYRCFSTEASHYVLRVNNQDLIFRTQCIRLLSEFVSHSDATQMMERKESNDQPISDHLLKSHGMNPTDETLNQCMETVKRMLEILQNLLPEHRMLVDTLEAESQRHRTGKNSARKARKAISRKVQFSFAGTRLQQNVDILTALNVEFMRLIDCRHTVQSCELPAFDLITRRDLRHDREVGEASHGLYTALSQACSEHDWHHALLCVEEAHLISSEALERHLQFKLAFSGASKHSKMYRFAVKTILNTLENDCSSQKRTLTPEKKTIPSCDEGRARKRVRLFVPFRGPKKHNDEISAATVSTPEDPIQGDFCKYLIRSCDCTPEVIPSIGILYNSTERKDLVYPEKGTSDTDIHCVVSLSRLISLQKETLRLFSIYQRIRLSKMISIAFLRYFSSPWAKACLESSKINFFDNIEQQTMEPIRVTAPHLSAEVCKSEITDSPSLLDSQKISIHRLGTLFLQIAYCSDVQDLKRRYLDDTSGGNDLLTDEQAKRLSELRSSGMPVPYHRIIKKLMGWENYHGGKFLDDASQTAFHSEVLEVLEKLERRLRDTGLDV